MSPLSRFTAAATEYHQHHDFLQGLRMAQDSPIAPSRPVFVPVEPSIFSREWWQWKRLRGGVGIGRKEGDFRASHHDQTHRPPACYRVPSLATLSPTSLLAFAEARHVTCSDHAITGIVMRRSDTTGLEWSDPVYVVPPLWPAGNPTTLVDHGWYITPTVSPIPSPTSSPATVHHPYTPTATLTPTPTFSPTPLPIPTVHLYYAQAGDLFTIASMDRGITWTTPRNLSESLGTSYRGALPGPGNALVTPSGRYVVPLHYATAQRTTGTALTLFSDDQGHTYHLSTTEPNTLLDQMDESSVVHVVNRTLAMYMRNANTSCECKARAVSHDEGTTWTSSSPETGLVYEPQLAEPVCEGSATRIGSTLLYIGPNMRHARSNLAVWTSSVSSFDPDTPSEWTAHPVVDDSVYSGYSAVSDRWVGVDQPQPSLSHEATPSKEPKEPIKRVAVLWEGCRYPMPFRVWCFGGWGIWVSLVDVGGGHEQESERE